MTLSNRLDAPRLQSFSTPSQQSQQTAPVRTDDPPQQATTLSRDEFVTAMADKGISAATLAKGVNVAAADLNGDGVISGKAEANALFTQLDKFEKAKTGPDVVSLEEAPVKAAVEALQAAEGGKTGRARYQPAQLENMQTAISDGGIQNDTCTTVPAGTKDYLGRKLSPDAIALNITNRATTTVVHDPKLGFMKQLEGGPLVPMTGDEIKAFQKNFSQNRPEDFGNDEAARLWNRMFPKDKVMLNHPD